MFPQFIINILNNSYLLMLATTAISVFTTTMTLQTELEALDKHAEEIIGTIHALNDANETQEGHIDDRPGLLKIEAAVTELSVLNNAHLTLTGVEEQRLNEAAVTFFLLGALVMQRCVGPISS